MKDLCYGCHDFSLCPIKKELESGYPPRGKLSDCPCSICLIKGMCIKQCEDFILYNEKFFSFDNVKRLSMLFGRYK